MRVLVECTHVFFNPEVNSGIQRVVKNIVENIPEGSDEVIPVVLKGCGVFRVSSLDTKRFEGKLLPWSYRFERFRDHCKNHSADSFLGVKDFSFWRQLGLDKLLFYVFNILANCLLQLSCFFGGRTRLSSVVTGPDDVLVLLDSSWSESFFPKVEGLAKSGVKVFPVVYDVIPIVNPEFHNEKMVYMFRKWLIWTMTVASGYLAISNSVVDELKGVLSAEFPHKNLNSLFFSSFRLGSNLKAFLDESEARANVKAVYSTNTAVYLSVGTIEPRKNYGYQLDSFDCLWAAGLDVCLCIVGRVGWQTDSLMARIHTHPEFGRRLFVFHDLDDHELIYCYRHSKALLFTSIAEGFGLPLVEASYCQLPVICSDIPVFREVGGKSIHYCDLSDVGSLIGLVESREACLDVSHISSGHCLSWKESTADFLKVLSKCNFEKQRLSANE